jgi:hypothetical protein
MMSEFIMDEGSLNFDFTNCGMPTKFDTQNNSGLHAVDFFIEREDYLLFIEVKDYQNPHTPREQQIDDYDMLKKAGIAKKSVFALEMGGKIKDSLLNLYAKGESFTKNVVYLLFINCDALMAAERQRLFDKIRGHIPTGLNNNDRFTAFKEIKFKPVNVEKLKKYGIICKSKDSVQGN